MRTAEASDGFGRATGGPADDRRLVRAARRTEVGGGEQVRCPSCSRLLVLRSGPAVSPHFAHRPRQSCRRGPERSGVRPLRLEQLTLFDVAELGPSEPFVAVPELWVEPRRDPRRRRRAWLPRLIRWIKGLHADRRSSAFTPETRGSAGPRI